eukprot:1184102-Prorocentrum_minimum.AAC.1
MPAHAHTPPHLQPRICACAHTPTPAAPCLHMRTHPHPCSPVPRACTCEIPPFEHGLKLVYTTATYETTLKTPLLLLTTAFQPY